jgi:acyl-CoA synthetase (AMP-forming)/AMP-acid ligase II
MSPDIFERLESRIGPHQYVNNYGFTEATGVVCLSRPGDPPRIRWGKMRLPLEGMEVKVVHPDTGQSIAAGREAKSWSEDGP